jgi:type IV secretory pathway VirJ component
MSFHNFATALATALSVILLCAAMDTLVVRYKNILPGAVTQLPVARSKGVALLMIDPSHQLQQAMYVDALMAQSYAVVVLPSGEPTTNATTLGFVADQMAARTGLASHPPVLVAIGPDSSRYAATLLGNNGTVHALVSVDFCPGTTTPVLAPAPAMRAPWYALQHRDAGCAPAVVQQALALVPNTHLTWIAPDQSAELRPAVEFGALLQWLDPTIAEQGQASASVSGIPLIERPVKHARRMVVFLSGDGGWAEFDRGVAAALNDIGIAVLGWDSLSYFWKARSPVELARDLAKVVDLFAARWHVQTVVVAGFSFGASSVPFAVSGLPATLRERIEKVVMLGPTPTTSFEFRLTQWLGSDSGDAVAVAPEVAKLAPLPVWCLHGEDDSEAACPPLAPPSRVVVLPGDHHFNGDYAALAQLIAAPPFKR